MQQTTPSSACAGREAELGTLSSLYEEARNGSERIAWLVGPSGVGKTRILQEFRSRVRLDGGIVLDGHPVAGQAFGPFQAIVEQALRFLDEVGKTPSVDLSDLGCHAGCHRLWHQHGSAATDATRSSSPLSAAFQESEAHERRARFFETIRGLLADVGQVRAPVILLHELERADRGTRELLSYLLDTGTSTALGIGSKRTLSALFVASVRQDVSQDANLASLYTHETSTVVDVRALDAEGVRALLQSPEIVSRVLAKTGGMPETIESLLETDLLSPQARAERRLNALSPSTRHLVEAMALIETPLELEAIANIASVEFDSATRHEFSRCEFIQRTINDGLMVFVFARSAERERVAQSLSPAARLTIHSRASHVFEARGELHTAARHALAADDHSRATPLALAASHAFTAHHAHAEAAHFLEEFIAKSSETDRTSLHERCAELYRLSGNYKAAIDHARIVAELTHAGAESLMRLGELAMLSGEHAESARALERALERAHDNKVQQHQARALLAELNYQRANYEAAKRWALLISEEATRPEELTVRIHARNTLGKIYLAERRSFEEASLCFEQNRADAERAGLGQQEAQALTNLGVAALTAHRLEDAERFFTAGMRVARERGDLRDEAICTENLAVLAHFRNDWQAALDGYSAAMNAFKRLGNRALLARAANNLGELYLSLGDKERARTLCEMSTQLGGVALPLSVTAEALLLRGRVEAAFGHSATARATLEAATGQFENLGGHRVFEVRCELARLALEDGATAIAEAYLDGVPHDANLRLQAKHAVLSFDLARANGEQSAEWVYAAVDAATRSEDPEQIIDAQVRRARHSLERHATRDALAALDEARAAERKSRIHLPNQFSATWETLPFVIGLREIEALASTTFDRAQVMRSAASVPPQSSTRMTEWQRKYPSIAGHSPQIQTVMRLVDRVAASDALVLIRGESGTGKELVAEALHVNSERRDKPFVKVNCAALVETLLLSELFGHERGAFTGATTRRKGRFELADGGTLFLDEIGDISPKTQVALLRVLQEREFERVGGTQAIKVDVRIICATHRDLEAMVKRGEFREDLYYRLRGVQLEMPALRNRIVDLPLVTSALLARIAKERGEATRTLSAEALDLLARHRWPGNVRELENVLRSATLFADDQELGASDFVAFAETFGLQTPEPELAVAPSAVPSDISEIELAYLRIREGSISLFDMKKNLERECILKALNETRGNITKAAQLLGMKRPRLSQLVKEYGLQLSAGEE